MSIIGVICSSTLSGMLLLDARSLMGCAPLSSTCAQRELLESFGLALLDQLLDHAGLGAAVRSNDDRGVGHLAAGSLQHLAFAQQPGPQGSDGQFVSRK